MKNVVIFLTNIPFMKHHVQDMYINEISEVFMSELWDLSALYRSKYQLDAVCDSVKISSESDFETRIQSFVSVGDNVVFITNILCDHLGIIYPIVNKYNIPLININKDLLALSLEERGALNFMKYFNIKSKLFAIARNIPILKQIIQKRSTKGYKYDYLMGGANYYPEQTRHFMRIHQIKYDEYLRAKNSNRLVEGKYLLFVGAGPTSHPAYTGYPHTLDHQYYMRVMRKYLDYIEAETGLKVVISGHPKGLYKSEEWGNRPIYMGNTANLIHYCEGVICHFSTSLVNAVLEYKPIQIIYDDTILKSAFRKTMVMGMQLGKICNADLCNMDAPHKWDMKVDDSSYDKFLREEIINDNYKDKSDAELINYYLGQIFEKEYNK